jgi:hypothetical protein
MNAALQAAEKTIYFVFQSEARNDKTFSFSAGCLATGPLEILLPHSPFSLSDFRGVRIEKPDRLKPVLHDDLPLTGEREWHIVWRKTPF